MQKIGVYQDGTKLKVASLSEQQLIERLDTPSHFLKEEWPGLVVSGVGGDKILVRHIQSPLKNRRSLEKTLPFQLEELIPFSLEEVIVRPIYQVGKEQSQATFFVVSEDSLKAHIEAEQGMDPSWVSCIPMALYRFAAFTGQDKEGYLVFHVGHKSTEIVSIYRDMVQHNISLNTGIDHFESAYERDRPEEEDSQRIHSMRRLDLRNLKNEEYPHLFAAFQDFQREVDRAFCFLSHKLEDEEINFLLFAGETETTFQLEAWLKSSDTFNFSILPIEGHRGYDAKRVKTYAIPIGLALDALKQDKKSIQFRQGNWVSNDVYKAIKKRVVTGVTLCLVSAATLFVTGHLIYAKKEKSFLSKIDHFAETYKGELPKLDKIFLSKTQKEKIQFLNRNIKILKNNYGYFESPTLVADVLAFLSEHPCLNRQEGDKKIEMNHLHYEFLKHPSIKNPFHPYKVKVSVEFTSPESSWAREFHDAIVDDTKWVDVEEEITWAREQNAYTLSFILK